MTIELLTIPLERLEAMSFAELENYFAPMFNVTRPVRQIGERSGVMAERKVSDKKRKADASKKQLTPEQQKFLDDLQNGV